MIKKRLFAVAFVLTLAASIILAGCSDISDKVAVTSDLPPADLPPVKEAYPVGVGSEKFEASPSTVASLSPAITQIISELGADNKLIAVSDYCDYFKDGIEKIGSPALPDIDKIIELSPELLITQSPIASADVVRLKQAGVRTLYIGLPKSFSGLCEEYINLALIFYGSIDSKEVAVSALSGLDSIMTEISKSGINTRFIALGESVGDDVMAFGSDCLSGEMLSIYGENLLGDIKSGLISIDELSRLGPDTVFADESLKDEDIEDAFPDARIIYCDMGSFEQPTVSLSGMMGYLKSELEK